MAAKDVASRHIMDRIRLESDLLPLITKYPAVVPIFGIYLQRYRLSALARPPRPDQLGPDHHSHSLALPPSNTGRYSVVKAY